MFSLMVYGLGFACAGTIALMSFLTGGTRGNPVAGGIPFGSAPTLIAAAVIAFGVALVLYGLVNALIAARTPNPKIGSPNS